MYEVKWTPKTAAELEELCNKALEHGFELVAMNESFCVFKSAQHSVQADGWTRDENGVMERTISPDVQKKMPSRRH